MSRIILSKYADGRDHVVVGWDHPAHGCFWQEWATQEEIAAAERVVAAWEDGPDAPAVYEAETIAETGVKRNGGVWPGIPIDRLRSSMPEDLRPLITGEVLLKLEEHAEDPDSGRWAPIDWAVAKRRPETPDFTRDGGMVPPSAYRQQ